MQEPQPRQQPSFRDTALLATGFWTLYLVEHWVRLLSRMPFDRVVPPVALGAVCVSGFKLVMAVVPGFPTALAVALFPLVCLLCLRRAESAFPEGPSRPEPWFTADVLQSLASPAGAVAVFLLVWSLLNMSLKAASGHYGYGDLASPALVAAAQAIDVAFAALLAWWVARRRAFPEFNQIWRLAFVCLALSLVTASLSGMLQAAQVFTSAAYEMADAVLWITLADVARHTPFDKTRVVALGFAAMVRLPDWLGRTLVNTTGADVLGEAGVVALMFAILCTVAFLLPHRSPGVQLLFRELDCTPASGSPAAAQEASVEERCADLAQRYGLTARELEIVQYLCYGRSKQYIAETLYLSENTVRTYTRRIYAKMGVHSKSELQDMAGIG